MSEIVVVKSSVIAKQAPDFKPIKHRTIAGISETELLERYTIGEYSQKEEEEKEKEDKE